MARVWARVRPRRRLVRLTVPGTRTRVYARSGTSDLAAFADVTREWADVELPFAPSVILDLGANVGYASVALALRYPEARILAVEPVPANVALLRRNVAPFPVDVVEAAVWPRSGTLRLEDPGKGQWGFRVREGGDDVRAVTVPELIERTGAAAVGLVKLDVEGAELDLFTGDTGWLARVQALAVELHDRYRPGAREAVERAVAAAWPEYETSTIGEKALFVRTGG